MPPNETIALITMNVQVGSVEGMLNICIPYILLEPILDKLNTRFWFTTSVKEHSQEDESTIRNRILKTRVPLVAYLGSTVALVKDIVNIKPGDIIKLDKNTDSMLDIKVGSNVKFKGEIGTLKDKIAIKIIEVVKEGELEND